MGLLKATDSAQNRSFWGSWFWTVQHIRSGAFWHWIGLELNMSLWVDSMYWWSWWYCLQGRKTLCCEDCSQDVRLLWLGQNWSKCLGEVERARSRWHEVSTVLLVVVLCLKPNVYHLTIIRHIMPVDILVFCLV